MISCFLPSPGVTAAGLAPGFHDEVARFLAAMSPQVSAQGMPRVSTAEHCCAARRPAG